MNEKDIKEWLEDNEQDIFNDELEPKYIPSPVVEGFIEELMSTKQGAIDWEQRRYEIVREIAGMYVAHTILGNDSMAKSCVAYADAIIRELKKNNPEKEERYEQI